MNLDKKKYQIISWNQFSTTFNYSFDTYNDYSKYLSEIRLYKSDKNQNVYFNEDLIIDSNNDINYVINGNLIIDGNLEININDGIGNFLYVKGNIISDSILLSGYPNVEITNNAVIKNGIVGMYGDDGGCLYIHGEIVSPVVFNCLYFNMIFKNKANAMVVDASYGELDTKYKKNNLSEIILDELFENNEISESTLYNYVKSGKNIIKRQKSFFNKSKIKLPNNLKRSKSIQNDKSIISNNDSEKFNNSQTKNIQNYFLDSQKEKKKKEIHF